MDLIDLMLIPGAAMLVLVAYMLFVDLRAIYFRLLLTLKKVQLRPAGSLTLGDTSLVAQRLAVLVFGAETGIVLYAVDGKPLILDVPGFGPNPLLIKSGLVFTSKIGSPPIRTIAGAVTRALAENRWVSSPEVYAFVQPAGAP